MRIGIDARFYRESGIGRYLRNLLEYLQREDKTNEYYIFLLSKDLNIKLAKNFHKVEANIPWYGLSEQIKLPKLISQYNLDLVHFPHFNIPINYKGKFVVTIHDLIHQHFQLKKRTRHSLLGFWTRKISYHLIFSQALKKSQKIITVSDFTKKQLVREWKVPEDKVKVTLEAVDQNIIELTKKIKKEDQERILDKFKIQKPYIFYVGNAYPHKNVEGLVKAFLEIRRNYQYLQLVLAGNDHYFWRKIKEKYQDKNIIYAGFVSDEEMVALYKEAACYIVPSFEEGFGIPLLEAMACGTPVVSSDAASLPEIGGDAAIYFDPKNINEMSQKIMEVLNSQKIKKELIEKGEKRYKDFSWEKLARETLEVYRQCG
jgi:glycosyltransferase involved in cell wall biosynthesis